MVRPYPKEFPPLEIAAATALHRLGYGARPGEIEVVARDPRGWALSQIDARAALSPELQSLPSGASLAIEEIQIRANNPMNPLPRSYTEAALAELAQHLVPSLTGPAAFTERLVRFWSEFFFIPCESLPDIRLALAFEREVIRPHLFGTLSGLLTAAAKHPALLLRFNHLASIGQYSVAGLTGAPNLLSTLPEHILTNLAPSKEGSPNPADIRALANMMTGWSVATPGEQNAGAFVFRGEWHEPNVKRMFSRDYPEAGVLEGEAALDSLSRQEYAVRYIATRMAFSILGESASSGVIGLMVRGFVRGGNSLSGMVRALVEHKESWEPTPGPIKTPIDLALSTAKALDLGAESVHLILTAMRSMGQTPFLTQTRQSWRSPSTAWLAPEPFLERLEWASSMGQWGGRWPQDVPAVDIALVLMGARLDPQSYRRLAVTIDRSEGLALAFATPGFQRR